MKKIISIISLVLCMLVCLTACGEKSSDVDTSKDSQPQGYVAMAEDEGGKALVGVGFMLYDSKGTELTWLPMATNSRGKVEFKDCKETGCYVQVKTVPVGYELDSETKYYFDEEGSVKVTIKEDPNANWIGVGDRGIQDMFITVGAHTITSVNTYPDLEKWEKIDPNHEFIDVYNRYAHMNVNLTTDEPSKFENVPGREDIISVTLNVDDLKKLNVTYIESKEDLSQYSTANVELEKIYSYKKLQIYKVNYLN